MAPSARTRRRQERTEEILSAAMEILVEGGSQALTMRTLAKSLALTPGAVYRYFDGKDAIIAALAHRTLRRYSDAQLRQEERAYAHAQALPEVHRALFVLLARAMCYWNLSVADPSGRTLINFIMVRQQRVLVGDAHDQFVASVSAQLHRVAELCETAVSVGALHPGNSFERGLVILAILHGNLQHIKLAGTSPVPFSAEGILRTAIDGVLIGWGASPSILAMLWPLLDALPEDAQAPNTAPA